MTISPAKKQILRWIPAILFMLGVLFLSTQKVPHLRCWNADKLVHFVVYGIMSMLVFWPLSRNKHNHPYVFSICIAIATGILDESIQHFNPSRVASLLDLLADGFGAVTGSIVSRRLIKQ